MNARYANIRRPISKSSPPIIKPNRREKRTDDDSSVLFYVGIYLFFRAVTSQVLSAQVSLTSVFGMGTGGPSPLSTPTMSPAYTENIHILMRSPAIVNRKMVVTRRRVELLIAA